MKFKTLGRIAGIVDATAWSIAGYLNYKMLSNYDYNKFGEFLTGDYPLEHKIVAGLLIGTEVVFVPIIATGITDGIVDIVKGTHHYLGMQAWRRLTGNPKKKEQIDRVVAEMFDLMERPLSYKA